MKLFGSNFSVGTRIYSISAGLIFAIILVSIVAFWVVSKLSSGFSEFKNTADVASKVVYLDKLAGDIYRDTQVYVLTGHESRLERINASLSLVQKKLDSSEIKLDRSEETKIVEKLKQHIQAYKKQLQTAAETLSQRDRILLELEYLEKEIIGDLSGHVSGKRMKEALLLSHGLLYRYLTNFNAKHIEDSLLILDKGIESIATSDQVSDTLSRYRTNFLRVVQTTRGYLFLVNVVLAAEAAEFTYNVKKITKRLTKNVAPLSQEIIDENRQYAIWLAFATIFVVLFGVFAAATVSRGISAPLAKIASVFSKLTLGKTFDKIPHTDRKDEIGNLARAAEVFRQKNEETLKLLEEVKKSREELERSNDELDQFVYTVSHDLKSPIVTCTGFSGMIKELAQAGKRDEALAKIDIIDKALARMSQLIKDLLDLSRVGRTDLDMTNIDANNLVKNVLASHNLECKSKGISLSIQPKMENIFGNESRVSQVIENLVGNAIKYLPSDGTGKIEIGVLKSEKGSRLFVRDNGPGIKPEYHEKVFGLFQRLASKNTPGTGIGLSIVQKVMKFHDGSVWIDSKGDGNGTSFWAEFPRASKSHKVQSA